MLFILFIKNDLYTICDIKQSNMKNNFVYWELIQYIEINKTNDNQTNISKVCNYIGPKWLCWASSALLWSIWEVWKNGKNDHAVDPGRFAHTFTFLLALNLRTSWNTSLSLYPNSPCSSCKVSVDLFVECLHTKIFSKTFRNLANLQSQFLQQGIDVRVKWLFRLGKYEVILGLLIVFHLKTGLVDKMKLQLMSLFIRRFSKT